MELLTKRAVIYRHCDWTVMPSAHRAGKGSKSSTYMTEEKDSSGGGQTPSASTFKAQFLRAVAIRREIHPPQGVGKGTCKIGSSSDLLTVP